MYGAHAIISYELISFTKVTYLYVHIYGHKEIYIYIYFIKYNFDKSGLIRKIK